MKEKLLIIVSFLQLSIISVAQDFSLDHFLTQALNNSPLLKDYQNQVQANLIDSQMIRASYKPQVMGNSVNVYAPVIGGFGYDQAISNGGNFSSLVAANKTLVGRKNLENQFLAINLLNQGVRNTAKISEQDLKKSITAQYITAYGDLLQLNFNKEVSDLLHKEESILKELTQRNVYRQTDYLTFLVTLQQQALQYKQLQIQFRNDIAQLNYLSGINDTSAVVLLDPGIYITQFPDPYNSVFFKQYEIDSLKLRNNRATIDFSYRPKANIFVDGGYSSSLAYQAYKNFGTSFGLSIMMPIYDGHQRKLKYTKLDIAERTRIYYKSFFTNQYYQQIAQLTQQLRSTEELIGQINDQIKYAESLIKVNSKLLEMGDAKIADYIIAFSNYLNARNLLTQNSITRLQIINQINYWNR